MGNLGDALQATLGNSHRLERELGGGGMSRVFLAEETRFRRRVVIKVLAPELAAGVSAERFEREITLAAGLQQANIVPVLTAGMMDTLPYYTMPFVEGESLRHRLARGPLPAAEAVSILRDVARALAYAHAQGIVHRDIKPENVLLSSGTAVVTDFGIAKALSASKTLAPGGPAGAATLTQVGTSLGSPAYMAPEQATGDDVDARADIYAWGVMVYELLAGRHPFVGRTSAQQLVVAHIAEAPQPLREVAPAVPAPLAALVMRALEKDRGQRPAAAADLLESLDAGRGGDPSAGDRRGGRIRRFAAVAVALAIIGGGAGVAAWTRATRVTDAASIAVLPFEHQGPAEQAFFADGLTDALTGKLIAVPGLTVIDRRSAATYRGATKTAAEIGRELDVAYLLRGTVTWVRDAAGGWRAQVRPTLVRTRDGAEQQVGEPVVVTPDDPFTAQAEIATRVVSEIGIAIDVRERTALAAAPTTNAEAYELYLRGRALADPSRPGGRGLDVAEAARLLERATRLDPSFDLAFAELALVEHQRTLAGDTAAAPRVEAAIGAALALDPELPEAHWVLALHRGRHEARYAEALAAAARASAGKPGDAQMLGALAEFQIISGRVDEGFANLERAVALDPRNWQSTSIAAQYAWFFRRLDDAERHARRMTALAPFYASGPFYTMVVALARGDTAEARRIRAVHARAFGEPQLSAVLFWLLPPSLARLPGRPPGVEDPDLAPGRSSTDSVGYYAMLGAWARETGQPARSRAWFDSLVARVDTPRDVLPGRRQWAVWGAGSRAVALAGAGRAAEARRMIAFADSIERLNGVPHDPWSAMGQDYLSYAELLLGDRDATLARLERLLVLPSGRTPAMLRTMWPYLSLHDDPRFRRLAEMDGGDRRVSAR